LIYEPFELIELLPAGRQVSNLLNQSSDYATPITAEIAEKSSILYPAYPALSSLSNFPYHTFFGQVSPYLFPNMNPIINS
jgi:hypothetical protein